MNGYLDLQIFTESKQLAVRTHKMSLALPKFEMYEEGSQVRRSAKSIPSNILEGFIRRRYKADYVKHLVYASGESDETMLHLDILFDTGSLTDEEIYRGLKGEYHSLSKKINKFIQWVENH